MQSHSIKKNFAYKSTLTVSNYLMAFITFPYISRVLGVENVGLVNFVDNTINYFLLFASMGVNVLGVREIAKAREDIQKRSSIFSNILGVNFFFTLVTLFVYFVIITSVQKFEAYKELLYIGAAKILFSTFLIEWLYTGAEDFRYITIRSVLIKVAYILLVFLLVKQPDDYRVYFYLTTSVTIVNALINIIHSRKFVKINFRELFNFKYLRDNITLGIYSIMTSMYLTFNVIYLGLVSDNIQVGYYTTAYKLYSVILGFFSAFTNVMLPRMSSLAANGEKERFQNLIDKSFSVMVMFCIPLIVCSMILAPDIIYALSGLSYDGAITPMKIIMPAILFVGIAQILAMQILMPLKKDNVLLIASMLGASVSILINFFFVKEKQAVGSALVLLCSECTVTITYLIYTYRNKLQTIPWCNFIESFLKTLPCALICLICRHVIANSFIILAIAVPSCVTTYYLLNRKNIRQYSKAR